MIVIGTHGNLAVSNFAVGRDIAGQGGFQTVLVLRLSADVPDMLSSIQIFPIRPGLADGQKDQVSQGSIRRDTMINRRCKRCELGDERRKGSMCGR